MIRFGYVRPLADPEGKGLVTTKAKKFDKRRMWRTERGAILRPRDFEDEHLINTIRYIRRRALEQNFAMWAMVDASGDDVQDAWGSELPTLKDEEHYPILRPLCRELKRRGLEEKDPFERNEIRSPFVITLHEESHTPLQLRSKEFGKSKYVMFTFKNPGTIGLDRKEIVELRDTLTKILAGWR